MQDANTRNGIIAWFARNSVAANLLMLIIIIAGWLSIGTLEKRAFPKFESNTIRIATSYPGASPVDIEKSINIKIEEAIDGISGVEDVTSMAWEGASRVYIDVESGFELTEVKDQVKAAVESISGLPSDSEIPRVTKTQSTGPIMWMSVYGDVSQRTLHDTAQQFRDELLALPEVTKIRMIGAFDLVLAIEISEHTLRQYDMTFEEVARELRQSSVDIAAGNIETRGGDIVLKTRGQATSNQEFGDMVLRSNPDGSHIRLRDIADIREEFDSDNEYGLFDGKNSISLRVVSLGSNNDLKTAEVVRNWISEKQDELPEGVQLKPWGDFSYYLEGRLDLMTENMLYGAILVFLILGLFLRLRVAMWVMMGIPISFLGALWLMPVGPFPVSINMISLFAFILVLGVVVDDAIIIGESIYTEIDENGHTVDNVIKGVNRVVVPATFGVLTTMAAFAPILFIGGQAGPFMESIAVVVILCLLFSLVESKLILPAHMANMKNLNGKKSNGPLNRFQDAFNRKLQSFIHGVYKPLLEKAVSARYTTMAFFFGLLFITIGTMQGGLLRFAFFPDVPSDFIEVDITMNIGSTPESRDKVLETLEDELLALDKAYQAQNPGSEPLIDHTLIYTDGDTEAGIFVELSKSEGRLMEAPEIADEWRERVGSLAGLKKLDIQSSTNSGGGKPISLLLASSDDASLERAAKELEEHLKTIDGVFNVENSFETGSDEIVMHIRPEARALGVSLRDLGRQVRQGFYGEEVERFQRGNDEIRVLLRYPEEERQALNDLENVRIRTSDGRAIPIGEVAELEFGKGFSWVRRRNGLRSINVSADVDDTVIESGKIIKDVRNEFIPELLSRYPGITDSLGGASLEEQQIQKKMMNAAVFALFLIYALIAIPLRSYSQPLIIMSIIPFGLIGAVFGHVILDISLSMMSIFGLIALSGVLVNDSLILVDFINKGRAEGVRLMDAVLRAGTARFRAIILTSLTTFLGLVPITLESSLQAQFVIPMAVSLGFGILFATVITLFLIPSLYLVLNDCGAGWRNIKNFVRWSFGFEKVKHISKG